MTSYDDIEKRFMDYCLDGFPRSTSPNREAEALLHAIQRSYDGSNMGKGVAVDPYLIHNLVACAQVALCYDAGQQIPWESSDHDYILKRTLRGFMKSIAAAIKLGLVREEPQGKFYLHTFPIPQWLYNWAQEMPF
jgi:hypothetical protein